MGLYQGSALSHFLFTVTDKLSDKVRTIMFSDDIVISSESKEQVEESEGLVVWWREEG